MAHKELQVTLDSIVGDKHNFGQTVHQIDQDFLFKPRTLYWEWLFLSAESELRKMLHDHFSARGLISPFTLIPTLTFHPNPDRSQTNSGLVSRLILPHSLKDVSTQEFAFIGSFLALISFFGISDLHSDNIIAGRDSDNRLIIAPIDIECIFADFLLPHQSLLIPVQMTNPKLCGLREVFFSDEVRMSLLDVAAVVSGYLETMFEFERARENIYSMLFSEKSRSHEQAIRLIFRPTKEYLDAMKKLGQLDDSFSGDEVLQMRRGDVPFFWRFLKSEEVFFQKTQSDYSTADVSTSILSRVMKYERRIESLSDALRGFVNREALVRAGSLQIAKVFCENFSVPSGRARYDSAALEWSLDKLSIEHFFGDGNSHRWKTS